MRTNKMGVQDNFNETDESLELENTNLVKTTCAQSHCRAFKKR